MTTQPEPKPEEHEVPPERHVEEEEMRGPGPADPDDAREDVGLDEPLDRD